MKQNHPKTLCGLWLAIQFCLWVTVAYADDEGGDFAPMDATTKAECSACHTAYPAELLPASSWNKILDNLGSHFGEDATLDPAQVETIRAYLTTQAMPVPANTNPADLPIRITDYPWYKRIHGKRLAAQAKADPKIGTLSNCSGCHTGL